MRAWRLCAASAPHSREEVACSDSPSAAGNCGRYFSPNSLELESSEEARTVYPKSPSV